MDRRTLQGTMGGMDGALVTAAQALSRGEPLFALKLVALRSDAPALALRATALAQLGEYKQSKLLFQRAARRFGAKDPLSAARCVVALAELSLAMRDLKLPEERLIAAIQTLARRGDVANARYAQLLRARHALSVGALDAAEARLRMLELRGGPPPVRALAALAAAEIALRRMQPARARSALARAERAAQEAAIPALRAEVEAARQLLGKPLARRIRGAQAELLSLEAAAALVHGPELVIDACRRSICQGTHEVSLRQRPVLFALARALAEAAPRSVSREELIRVAFGMRRPNASLRARLRVAIGRLRPLFGAFAELRATSEGFQLWTRGLPPAVIAPPAEDQVSSLTALLSDGEGWSTSALALALGSSQRSVQRALADLEAAHKVRSVGGGRNRRWLAEPLTEFAPHMLLPGASRRT